MQIQSINQNNLNSLSTSDSPYTKLLELWEEMKALENEAAANPANAHQLFEQMASLATQMASVAKEMPPSEAPLFESLTGNIGKDVAGFENSFNGTSGIGRAYEFDSFDAQMQALFKAIVIG